MTFRFIYCVKKIWALFFTVLGIFTCFNIAKKPYLKKRSHIQNLNIFSKHNFWSLCVMYWNPKSEIWFCHKKCRCKIQEKS